MGTITAKLLPDTKEMNLYLKILKMRQEFHERDIKKSGHNNFKKFDYYELKDIKPVILELCLKYNVYTHVSFDEKAIMRVVNIDNVNDVIILHSPLPKFEIMENDSSKQGKMVNKSNATTIMQDIGAAETYTRRYFYFNLFDITDADSIDSADHTNKGKKKTATKTIRASKTAKKEENVVAKENIKIPSKYQLVKEELTKENGPVKKGPLKVKAAQLYRENILKKMEFQDITDYLKAVDEGDL
ncbi:MAG: ERF family protein [Methanobrevibacter sp.]|jgi:hypothetical protein|nr:ERF family protein [Methanobrevibacter sp.]